MSKRTAQPNWVFWLLATLLLASALLKAWMLATDPFADIRTGFSIGVLGSGIAIEVLIAYQLIQRNSFAQKWTLSFSVFTVFMCVSAIRLASGYQNCGCFGRVTMSQEGSLILNLIVLVVLVAMLRYRDARLSQVVSQGVSDIWNQVKPFRMEAIGLTLGLTLFVVLTTSPAKDWTTQLWAAQQVTATPLWLDDLVVGTSQQSDVTLTNISNSPVTVVGADKSCGCITLNLKPLVIDPGDEAKLSVLITPTRSGPFHHRLIYFLDSQHQQRVHVEILGTCKEKENEFANL